ncbi:MAG TPA: hypothetical protein VNO24_29400 [Blastocatellia bacterium]|nr:hypothetical protein [Blastocatellia bacterium]
MKSFAFRRYLLCVLALVAAAHLTVINPAFARATQLRTDGPQAQVEYSADELQGLRATLLDVVDAVKEMAGLLPDNTKSLERIEELRSQVEQFSAKDLTTFRRAIDPSKFDSAGVARARQSLADRKGSESFLASKRRASQNSDVAPLSAGFPSVPVFGNTRLSDDEIFAVDTVYLTAESLAVSIKDACLQTVVVLGEGGNTSTACIISDGVFFIAKAVWAAIHMNEDHITTANVDTSYARLGHIHTDLENSVANDNTNAAGIKGNTDSNAASIKANTDSKAASIISNANSNTTTITNNANSNASSILTAISGAATSITSGSSSGQTQVKDLIVDTQIEADLARDTASTPVARYLIPSSAGGLLDRVRSVVVQTITVVQAAGGTTGTAQSFVTQGDQYKAAGQFKQAYDSYRRAYQMAARF